MHDCEARCEAHGVSEGLLASSGGSIRGSGESRELFRGVGRCLHRTEEQFKSPQEGRSVPRTENCSVLCQELSREKIPSGSRAGAANGDTASRARGGKPRFGRGRALGVCRPAARDDGTGPAAPQPCALAKSWLEGCAWTGLGTAHLSHLCQRLYKSRPTFIVHHKPTVPDVSIG